MQYLPRWFAVLIALILSISTGIASAASSSTPRVHVVAQGQRLGSIAKRYHVSIAAICNANGIRRSDRLHPGQRLLIPDCSDKDGSAARSRAESTPSAKPGRDATPEKAAPHVSTAMKRPPAGTHVVARGQRLGSIAKRYRVSIDALCQANGIRRSDRIHPGQTLVIPGTPGSAAAAAAGHSEAARSKKADRTAARRRAPSWAKYVQKPRRRGYVTLVGFHGQWSGYLVGKGRRVLPAARKAISLVMAWPRNNALMDTRLLQLLARVSDEFGGRSVRLVSGWRNTSFSQESRHKHGRAMDFSIPGVPNEALRDYLHTLENVGVGYYPNSTFVHLDTRDVSAFWTDYAGPGEPPRYHARKVEARADGSVTDADTDAKDTAAKQVGAESARASDAEAADQHAKAPQRRPTQEDAAVAQ
ncbi:MAG: LysM peptidoglycan-binding domain-containing protein [Polyangiaceae bacterium]|nr:LysM peptidoglycan-binding domain-containing protein [Polyangiaceae bacterium]